MFLQFILLLGLIGLLLTDVISRSIEKSSNF